MRGYAMVVVVCTVIGFLARAAASEKPPEAISRNMQDLNAASTDLRESVDAKDFAAVAKSAASLQALLKTTVTFWQQRKVTDAVTHARNAAKATSEVGAAAKAHDEDGVIAAHRALLASCDACHTAHRERTKDGKYEIK